MRLNSHSLLLLTIYLVLSSCSVNSRSSRNKKDNNLKDKPLTICVISDLNSSYGSVNYSDDVKTVIAQLSVIKPDIILCAGDMVAAQKASLSTQEIQNMYAGLKSTVLDPINDLGIPFGFTVGNHDASPSFTTDRQLSEKFWKENIKATNLDFADSSHYPFYYSYVRNNVFFMSWDAAGADIKPEVFAWMENELKSTVARKARLRILIGHLPLYAIVDSKNKKGEVNSDPEAALKFFKSNGIDLYISGHQHAYYPAEKEGIRFLNMGCIGDGPRKLIGDNVPARKSYTIINIPAKNANQFTYQTYLPEGKEMIDLKSLPDSVEGFNGISRKDIN